MSNTNFSTIITSPLELLRRYVRQAWLLHIYMIAALVVQPLHPQLVRADDEPLPEEEEIWSEPVQQSGLVAAITCPSGFSYNDTNEQKDIRVYVSRESWTVQTSNLGNTSTSEITSEPVENAEVTLTIAVDGGEPASLATGNTTNVGYVDAAFYTGSRNVIINASATVDGASTSAVQTFTQNESWSFSHDESLLRGEMTVDGATEQLAPNTERSVELKVTYETWQVWNSNLGGTEARNLIVTPADGAQIEWAFDSGNGSFSSNPETEANESGVVAATFVMGNQTTVLRAYLSYYLASSSSTAVTFTTPDPVETWQFDHIEGYLSPIIVVDGTTTELNPNDYRQVNVDVNYTTWEVWVSNFNNTQIRNQSSGAAIDAPVTFSIESGDGRVRNDGNGNAITVYTNWTGRASLNDFFMGQQDSVLKATVNYSVLDSSVTTTFNAPQTPEWSYVSTHQALDVSASVSNTTAALVPISVSAVYTYYEVWVNNFTQETEQRNAVTTNAIGAVTGLSVIAGDGTVGGDGSQTSGAGTFSGWCQAGTIPTQVEALSVFTLPDGGAVYGTAAVLISNIDVDQDTYSNADEEAAGTNPNDPEDKPETEPQYDEHWYQGSYSILVSWTEVFDSLSIFSDDKSVDVEGDYSISVAVGGWNWSKEHPDADPNWSLMLGSVTPNSVSEPPNGGYWSPGVTWENTGSTLTLDQTTDLQYGLLGIRSIYRLRELQYTISWRRLYRVPRN